MDKRSITARGVHRCAVYVTYDVTMSRSGSKAKLSSSGSRSSLRDKREAEEEEGSGGEVVIENVDQLAWKVLGKTETAELAGMDDPRQVSRKLAAVLDLRRYEESLSEAALVDYYVTTLWFACEHKFTDEQTSTLFTITHTLITKLKDQHHSLSDSIQQLQGMLRGVGVSPHQTAVKCLTPKTAREVVECVTTSLFQHYRLFQYLFEEQQCETQLDTSLFVEVPPPPTTFCPPPLDEAMPLELYERCLAPKPVMQKEPLHSEETESDQISTAMSNLTQEENELLMKVPPEELKAILDSLTSDTLSTYQTEVLAKLQEKEKAFIGRLSRLEQSLT